MLPDDLPGQLDPRRVLYPPAPSLVAGGTAVGLMAAAASLGTDTVDYAAATGLMWSVSSTLGVWLGVETCVILRSLVASMTNQPQDQKAPQKADSEHDQSPMPPEQQPEPPSSQYSDRLLLALGSASYLSAIPLLLCIFPTGIALLLHTSLGWAPLPFLLPLLLGSICGAALTLGMLAFLLMHTSRQVRHSPASTAAHRIHRLRHTLRAPGAVVEFLARNTVRASS